MTISLQKGLKREFSHRLKFCIPALLGGSITETKYHSHQFFRFMFRHKIGCLSSLKLTKVVLCSSSTNSGLHDGDPITVEDLANEKTRQYHQFPKIRIYLMTLLEVIWVSLDCGVSQGNSSCLKVILGLERLMVELLGRVTNHMKE